MPAKRIPFRLPPQPPPQFVMVAPPPGMPQPYFDSVTWPEGDGSTVYDDGSGGYSDVEGHSVGWPWDAGDPLNPSSFNPGKAIHDAVHIAQPILNVAHTILSTAQGVISLIPGIGTGISAAIGAGLAVLEGGGPLEIAIKTAYGAIPIPPGVRTFTDMVLDAALSLMHTISSGANAGAALMAAAVKTARDAILNRLPSGIARDLGGQVFDTLAHLIIQAIGGHPTQAAVTKTMHPTAVKAVQQSHVQQLQAAKVAMPSAADMQAMRDALAKALALHAPPPPPPKRIVHIRLPPHVLPIAPTAVANAGLHLAGELAAGGALPDALEATAALVWQGEPAANW